MPSLEQVIDRLLAATWKAAPSQGLGSEVHRAVDSVVLYHLMQLAVAEGAPEQVRAVAWSKLKELER